MNISPTQPNPTPWKELSFQDGIRTVEVPNFEGFFHFVSQIGSGGTDDQYLWRGQRRSEWKVDSTLARSSKANREDIHLHRFVSALARCTNIEYDVSNEGIKPKVWSIGQHWGLKTPLIDLCVYPYHALFFAFAEPDDSRNFTRAVFALDGAEIRSLNFEISESRGSRPFREALNNPPYSGDFAKSLMDDYGGIHRDFNSMVSRGDIPEQVRSRIVQLNYQDQKAKELKLYCPSTNENRRLHSQGGLHVYTPSDISVEEWVRVHHSLCPRPSLPLLTKILIPDSERKQILTGLNKMNINYMTLFPDFEGAAKHCNLALDEGYLGRIRGY
jgi:hypothetical protein